MKVHMVPGAGFSSNVFLVEGSEKSMLVDAGLSETSSYVLSELSRILGERKLDMLFLTHRHCDHIGGAAAISGRTGAKVLAPEGEADAIRNADHTTGASLFGMRVEPVEVEVVFPGSTISLGDVNLEIVHTPGHTSGSVVLFSRSERLLLSGDTVFADGGVGRWDLPTGSHASLASSLDKLCTMDIDSMYPGHGPPVECGASESIDASRRGLRLWG